MKTRKALASGIKEDDRTAKLLEQYACGLNNGREAGCLKG
jgi:hypothetical protein